MTIGPGRPFPLGATWDGRGVNFALSAPNATGVDLCLFDRADQAAESQRVPMVARTQGVWHLYLPDAAPGRLYGYRVHGPWDPSAGQRFNAAKLLLDPYAKAIGRPLAPHPSLFTIPPGASAAAVIDAADSAPHAPLAAVLDPSFDWQDDRAPGTPWHDTVIYEMHVKGFSALDESLDADLRGTYLGLAAASSIARLRALGVTAVELMPVHTHADEWMLLGRGLTDYWGYNTLSYFTPDARFATGGSPARAVTEFKTMVRALHGAGLEVILDVVYNHTAEGNELGPTLSWRGIDNAQYYRLDRSDPSRYEDFTGCGNTVRVNSPEGLQLVMDSLRYWVDEMHVDGFRFDLTSALARDVHAYDPFSIFFATIGQDPVLSRVKLIAEPWDVSDGGYQVGNCPPAWSEWNGRFRDSVRRFWRGDEGMLPPFATRLAGSSDLYDRANRQPRASINFVTAHDGFTLADLVSYNDKHNEANGEENRDGESHNISWNFGVEGPTDDPAILALRDRQRRNFLFTLFVSLGVPMLSGGDETGRTQLGNNNAYCQDSALSWTPGVPSSDNLALLHFVQRLTAIRAAEPVLRRRNFLSRRPGSSDVLWLSPTGEEMTMETWGDNGRRALGMLLDGPSLQLDNARAIQTPRSMLAIFNAGSSAVAFTLPAHGSPTTRWERVADTFDPEGARVIAAGGAAWPLEAHSAALFVELAAPPRHESGHAFGADTLA